MSSWRKSLLVGPHAKGGSEMNFFSSAFLKLPGLLGADGSIVIAVTAWVLGGSTYPRVQVLPSIEAMPFCIGIIVPLAKNIERIARGHRSEAR
jgi:hypothetical protein